MAPSKLIETAEERPTKRLKSNENSDHYFADGLLNTHSSTQFASAYATSKPYRHSVIPKLFQDDLLRDVRQEIMSNLVFTEKETDIYKVRQTGDLANLDGLDQAESQQLSNLRQLRNALYSPTFRDFVRSVTKVGPLSGTKIDMSINNYTLGCHLLNHDDVIGTRSVSYILYLPDPTEPWNPEFGGSLELYDVDSTGIPLNKPSLILPPSWNQFIMFAVQPGKSFHSVEEVVAEDRDRLSISGWFHVAQEGEEGYSASREIEGKSSLEGLLDERDTFEPYDSSLDDVENFTDAERSELSKFIDSKYLDLRTLSQINENFCEDSQIALLDFLKPDLAESLKSALLEKDKEFEGPSMKSHDSGHEGGWECHGPPHRQRYMIPSTTAQDQSSKTFSDLERFLASKSFRHWLALLISLTPISRSTSARRFRPGMDYTLATPNSDSMIEINLSLTPPDDAWESGELGGYCCYMAPHDSEDAAVYKAHDDDGVLLTSYACWNQLTIVMRDEGILAFTKYVAARAPGSRWDMTGQYIVDED